MAKIGFIGLGNMGLPMAGNLAKKGHDVTGFDLSKANLEAAAKRGIKSGISAQDVAKDADIVITMLPAGKDTIAVWGQAGTLRAAKKGTLFIDCSTIDVASSQLAHELAQDAGMLSLDAPVSGGVGGAEAGTLTLMCGGAKEAFEKAKPALEAMGAKSVYCGGAGLGQAAKICNNMMLGINMIGTSEAFVLAEKLGLDKQAVFDVISTSSGATWVINKYCPVPGPVPASPANNGYKPGFATALMAKDLNLSQEAARAAGVATPMGAHAAQLYRIFEQAGNGGTDCSAIVNFLRGTK
jgi:3-hydroxyisobutyrate dehydrogenase